MSDPKNKEYVFESMPVPQAVAKLAIPTVAASLVMILYNLADTFFVGKLNDSIETSAVTLAAPVLLAFNAVTNLFGVGCSSRMSRSLGEKDYDSVYRSATFGICGAVFFGFLFSLCASIFRPGLLALLGADEENAARTAAYLLWTVSCGAIPSMLNVVLGNLVRAEGGALHASIGTMSGCILNIFLDPVFIMPWGLGMGAAGAGLATFISNCVACLYFFVLLRLKKGHTYVGISRKYLFPGRKIVKSVLAVGVPASIQNLLNVTGMTILNNFMTVYGNEAVSAMGITHKVAMVPMYVSMGISQGIMPLIGYNYASGNRERMKHAVRFSEYIATGFMILSTAGLVLGSEGVIRIFMKDARIVKYGTLFLKGAALALPFLFLDFLAVAVFQACGMGRLSLIFAILRKIVLEIPAIVLLDKLFPMVGPAYAQFAAELILAAAAFILLERILSGKMK